MSQPTHSHGFAIQGALVMAVGVALGAFGAHGLEGRLSAADLATFETGVRYQLLHGLGLFAVAWARERRPDSAWIVRAGRLMLFGTVVFSGTLYVLVLTGPRWLGAVTPIGGVALITAWGFLALGLRRS